MQVQLSEGTLRTEVSLGSVAVARARSAVDTRAPMLATGACGWSNNWHNW